MVSQLIFAFWVESIAMFTLLLKVAVAAVVRFESPLTVSAKLAEPVKVVSEVEPVTAPVKLIVSPAAVVIVVSPVRVVAPKLAEDAVMLPDIFVVPRDTVAAVRVPVIFVGPAVCVTECFTESSSKVKALLLLKLIAPAVLKVVFDLIVVSFAKVMLPVVAFELKFVKVLTPLKVVAEHSVIVKVPKELCLWNVALLHFVSIKFVEFRLLVCAVKFPEFLFTSIIL